MWEADVAAMETNRGTATDLNVVLNVVATTKLLNQSMTKIKQNVYITIIDISVYTYMYMQNHACLLALGKTWGS